MSDSAIFLVGLFVLGTAIAATLVGTIAGNDESDEVAETDSVERTLLLKSSRQPKPASRIVV